MTKRTITRLLLENATGTSVEYVRKKGALSHIEVGYDINGAGLIVRLTDFTELLDAMHIEHEDEEDIRSGPDGGVELKMERREVDRLARLEATVHGPKGAEALKVAVSPKRLSWAIYHAVEELGISQLTELLSVVVDPEL